MTSPGGNIVEIRVVTKDQSAAGLNAATANVKKFATAVDGGSGSAGAALDSAEKKAKGLGSVLGNVGTIAGGILAADVIREGAQRVMALMHSTVEAASSLGESVNAVQKTFGESSAAVLDWGENNAAAAGLSTRAFNQMATPLGAMLKNQGLSLDEVSDHTLKLTQRAADMASVFNTDVTDALTAIQAGLRGEQDPLERYGVSLSAVAVEAKALADTHKTSTAQLTAAEKATARLNLIYEQTASTAGDFAQTSDGLANSQRIAAAEIENAQAKLGQTFLPIMAKAAQVSGNFAEAISAVPGPVAAAAAAVAVAGAGLLVFAPRIMATKEALEAMTTSQSRVTRGAGQMAIGIGKAGAGLAAITVAAQILGSTMNTSLNPQIEAFTGGLEEWAKSARLAGEAQRLLGDDADKLDATLVNAASSSYGFGKTLETWLPFLAAADQSATKVGERMSALDQGLAQMVQSGHGEDAAKIFAIVASHADEQGISIDRLKELLPQYSGAIEVAARSTDKLADANKGAAASLDEVTKKFNDLIDAALGTEEAEDAVANTVARLTEQIKKQKEAGEAGAGSLDRNTQAGRDNADMVRTMVRQYQDLATQYQEAGKSTDGLGQKLEDQLIAMGISREEAHRYAEQIYGLGQALQSIPQKVTAEIIIRQTIQETHREEARMYKRTGGISGAAGGGPRSNQTWVGEEGPELVDLPPGTMVHSNPDSMRMAGGAATPVQVNISFAATGDTLLDALILQLRKYIRVDTGGDVQLSLGRR